MRATSGAWDWVMLEGRPVRGQPMRAIPGRTRDESFHRCLTRLRGAGAALEMQSGPGTAPDTDLLLIGAPQHTLTAWASLQAAGARTARQPPSPPGRLLRVVALWRAGGTNLEMNAWLEAAQPGAVPLRHQMVFTNDTINYRVVTGVGTGLTIRVQRDATGLRWTLSG